MLITQGEVKCLMIAHQEDKKNICDARHRNTRVKDYGKFRLLSIVGNTYAPGIKLPESSSRYDGYRPEAEVASVSFSGNISDNNIQQDY